MNRFILLLLLCGHANAYPVFFHCDKNGLTSEIESSKELSDSLQEMKGLSTEEMDDLAQEYCKGSEECLARLKQAGILSKLSYEIVFKYYQDELLKLNPEAPALEVPGASVELLKKLKSMKELIACRKAQQNISSPTSGKLQLYYPFNSNYMFATGCRNLSSENCMNYSQENVREVVKRSILAGVDPYLFMALSMQEQGVQMSPEGLYLDPIGIIKSIGCDGKSTKSNPNAFASYGTYYSVKNGVLKRPDVTKYFETYFADKPGMTKKKSFLCNDTKDSEKVEVSEKPSATGCCLEIPYAVEADTASRHLVPFYIKDMQSKAIPYGQNDPAFTVQLYNGFSNLMGGAEGVSVFRSGLNFFKEPSYGYQGMDFIVNSLMVNKDLKALVKEEQQKLGQKSPSILCKGKSEGYYALDSDYYFNKHKNAKRMGIILDKYRQGKGYESLTDREKRVFDRELGSLEVATKLGIEGLFSSATFESVQTSLANSSIDTNKMYSEFLDRSSFKKGMIKFGLSPELLNIIYDYKLIQQISNDYEHYNEPQPQNFQAVQESKAAAFMKTFLPKVGAKGVFELKDYSREKQLQVMSKLGIFLPQDISDEDLKYNWGATRRELAVQALDLQASKHSKQLYSLKNVDVIFCAAEGALFKRKPVEEILQQVPTGSNLEAVKKQLVAYFLQVDAAKENKTIPKAQLFKRYFKEVYKERETVGQASSYPWRRFTDEEMQGLGQKVKN
jgi:hypothetical protein